MKITLIRKLQSDSNDTKQYIQTAFASLRQEIPEIEIKKEDYREKIVVSYPPQASMQEEEALDKDVKEVVCLHKDLYLDSIIVQRPALKQGDKKDIYGVDIYFAGIIAGKKEIRNKLLTEENNILNVQVQYEVKEVEGAGTKSVPNSNIDIISRPCENFVPSMYYRFAKAVSKYPQIQEQLLGLYFDSCQGVKVDIKVERRKVENKNKFIFTLKRVEKRSAKSASQLTGLFRQTHAASASHAEAEAQTSQPQAASETVSSM